MRRLQNYLFVVNIKEPWNEIMGIVLSQQMVTQHIHRQHISRSPLSVYRYVITIAPCVITIAPCVITIAPCVITVAPCVITIPPCVITIPPCVITNPPSVITIPPCLLIKRQHIFKFDWRRLWGRLSASWLVLTSLHPARRTRRSAASVHSNIHRSLFVSLSPCYK